MKALMFLLILDFSGSMYQKVNDQPKYVILQENVRALNQGLTDETLATQTGILSFGLNPKKKCEDFTYADVATKNISKTVDGYVPGAFSKTPLGESIRRGTDITIENQVKKVVIFSDGADSCGKDPCKELIVANEKLKAAKYTMNIKFIGINLKKNDPKFECFRNNKLSNINIDFSNIGDSFDVQEALQDVSQDGGISLQNVRSPWGIIKVRGAPPTVKFKAESKKAHIKNGDRAQWYGSYPNQLKGSDYFITSNYPGTKKRSVTVDAERETEILWGDFFKDPKSKVIYTRSAFSLMLVPAAGTLEAHRSVGPVLLEGLLESDAKRDIKIPFGDWQIEPVSPPWFKDMLGKKTFSLKPESSLKVNFSELLDLEWVKNPDPAKQWVISVQPPPEKTDEEEEVLASATKNFAPTAASEPEPERYLIQTGVESIPVPRGAKVNWIESNFQ